MTWILQNYYKDQEEDFEKIKVLCRFVNPEAAKAVFDTPEEEVVVSDDFIEEVQSHAGTKMSTEELQDRLKHPESYEDIDTIEAV